MRQHWASLLLTCFFPRFQTYFPHVDNIYSHRSTQNHKRKPFVSHYWDCRLKGRPPGTAKSEDPSKKKRKRQARERDLCDVKIKITEYFPEPRTSNTLESIPFAEPPTTNDQQHPPATTILRSNDKSHNRHSSASSGARYYTIQRVNGSGISSKDGPAAGGHKHTLEDSDKVKKNSIHRFFLKEEKEKRRSQVSSRFSYSGYTFTFQAATMYAVIVLRSRSYHTSSSFVPSFCNSSQQFIAAIEHSFLNVALKQTIK